jgi:hypothetical protein
MAYALKSSTPIIDPFLKVRNNNLTLAEQKHSGRDEITIGLLGVCKAFNKEGTRLIVDNNQFIFTQVTAPENFARISQPPHEKPSSMLSSGLWDGIMAKRPVRKTFAGTL